MNHFSLTFLLSFVFCLLADNSSAQSNDTLLNTRFVTVIQKENSEYFISYRDFDASFTKLQPTHEGNVLFNRIKLEDGDSSYYPYNNIVEYLSRGYEKQYIEEFEAEKEMDYLIPVGKWIEYDYYLNQITETNYVNGLRSGKRVSRKFNGDTVSISHYENDLSNGSYIYYHHGENNEVWYDTTTYSNGLKNGYCVKYYTAVNKVKSRGQYTDDITTGVWTLYDPFDQVSFVEYDQNGELVSTPIKLTPNRNKEGFNIVSKNGRFALTKNGEYYMLFDLEQQRLINGSIEFSWPRIDMGGIYNTLSNSGKYFATNHLGHSQSDWSFWIIPLLGDKINPRLEKFPGDFISFDYKDEYVLHMTDQLHVSHLKDSTRDKHVSVPNLLNAGFSRDGKRVYAVTKNSIFIYSIDLIFQDSLPLSFEIKDDQLYHLEISNDQLISLLANYNETKQVYDDITGYWTQLPLNKTTQIPRSLFPDEFIDYEFTHINRNMLNSFDADYLCIGNSEAGLYTILAQDGSWFPLKKMAGAYFFGCNSHNEIVGYSDSLNKVIYYQPFLDQLRSYGFYHSADISDGSIDKDVLTLMLNKPEDQRLSLQLSNLKVLSTANAKEIRHDIDSSYIHLFDSYQMFNEVYNFTDGGFYFGRSLQNMKHVQNLILLDSIYSIYQKSLHGYKEIITFENRKKETRLEQVVYLILDENGNCFFFTPDKYYCTVGTKNLLGFFEDHERVYPFENFDIKYNRPDIILDRLGYADPKLVKQYEKAYLKRLKKLNIKEDDLKDDYHLPDLEIKNYEEFPAITDEEELGIELQLSDTSYTLDRINIWLNSVPIKGSKGFQLGNSTNKVLDTTITVHLNEGMNTIEVSVTNEIGIESYREKILIYSKRTPPPPNLHFIGIGVKDYQDSTMNLAYSDKDIRDMAEMLSKAKGYGTVHIDTFLNENVTTAILPEIRKRLEQTGIHDQVIFMYSGHGLLDQELNYYLSTHDVDFLHPQDQGLLYDDVNDLFDGIPARKKLILLDACHSGELDKDEVELTASSGNLKEKDFSKASLNSVIASTGNSFELMKELFADLRRGTGATVISSSSGKYYSYEDATHQNGIYTYALKEGLAGAADANNDQEISVSELKTYLYHRVSELTNGKQKPTTREENLEFDFRVY